MLLTGARHALAPVLDIARDPRWGRIEETYGEDPYLAAVMGCAYVAALQGPDLADGVLATAKHMVGHGLAEGGLNQAPAHVGPRELRNEQLVPFEAAVRQAGIASVMPAYCDVDGVPCHASHELLTAILRDEWGFDGIVASDYIGHRDARDRAPADRRPGRGGAAGPRGGRRRRAAAHGRVRGARWRRPRGRHGSTKRPVDAAVERVLRMKFRLGPVRRPYVELPTDGCSTSSRRRSRAPRASLAEQSLVLLENDGVLPLAPGIAALAVVGPDRGQRAGPARRLQPPRAHGDAQGDAHRRRCAGRHRRRRGVEPGDELTGRRTILDALRGAVPGAEVVHARGTGHLVRHATTSSPTPSRLARGADVAIVVLGERSGPHR